MKYLEERLNREKHFCAVGDFRCGADDPLDSFLTDYSFEYDESRLGNTYLIFPENPTVILGFYTLKTSAIQTFSSDTKEYTALPMIEIARLAVHYEFQHSGIGRKIFYDYILPKVYTIAELSAVYGIIVFVDPYNENAIHYYISLGFERASDVVQSTIGESFNESCDLYILKLDTK